jgi:hypothetical protein
MYLSSGVVMSSWKDEDIATADLIKEYLAEFKEGISCNPQLLLNDKERIRVNDSLAATEKFCLELLLNRKKKLYMHDLILMAVGFYGGYLTALDYQSRPGSPNVLN